MRDLLAGLTVLSLVTGLSYILIVALLRELIVFSQQVTSLIFIHGFIMMSPLLYT